MSSEAQRKANLKYQSKKAQLKIWVDPEQAAIYKKFAGDHGISLTQMITDALNDYMTKDRRN